MLCCSSPCWAIIAHREGGPDLSIKKREKHLGEKRKIIDQIDATKAVVRLMGFTLCLLRNGVPGDGTDPVLMLTYTRCVQTCLIWADKPLFCSPLASPQSAAAPGAWQCCRFATPCMGRVSVPTCCYWLHWAHTKSETGRCWRKAAEIAGV